MMMILFYEPSISLYIQMQHAWLAVPDTDFQVTCSTDLCFSIQPQCFFYKPRSLTEITAHNFKLKTMTTVFYTTSRFPHNVSWWDECFNLVYFMPVASTTALVMVMSLMPCREYLAWILNIHTCAWRPIACVPSVTRAGETSFSVVTSCIAMTVMNAFDTFIYICSQKT